jgi:uncharacterized membrane protein
MKSKLEKSFLDSMSRNPANWRGLFYYNRKDPRMMVRKLEPGLGWTLNWANPYSYVLLMCLILIFAAGVIFL